MASGQQKWVIARIGASGYLPENTLPALRWRMDWVAIG